MTHPLIEEDVETIQAAVVTATEKLSGYSAFVAGIKALRPFGFELHRMDATNRNLNAWIQDREAKPQRAEAAASAYTTDRPIPACAETAILAP